MNCPECGAKPGRGGTIRMHKKGCPTKGVSAAEEKVYQAADDIIKATVSQLKALEPKPTCATCRFYAPIEGAGIQECRRFPPSQGNRWAWVSSDQWCGEYEARS